MKAVLDTNVVASGIFFGGVPRAILDLATRHPKVSELTMEFAIPLEERDERVSEPAVRARRNWPVADFHSGAE